MKLSGIILVFAISLTCLIACKNRKEELLKRIKAHVDTEGWEELLPMNEYPGGDKHYQLTKEDGDTTKVLQLIYIPKEDRIAFQLYRTFEDAGYKYELVSSTDTLYYYMSPLNNEDELDFFIGKYHFLYSRRIGELTEGQRCYYDMHIDSLKAIKGNNLPPLPEISCE